MSFFEIFGIVSLVAGYAFTMSGLIVYEWAGRLSRPLAGFMAVLGFSLEIWILTKLGQSL